MKIDYENLEKRIAEYFVEHESPRLPTLNIPVRLNDHTTIAMSDSENVRDYVKGIVEIVKEELEGNN